MTSIAPSSNNTVIDPNGLNKMNQAISDGTGQFNISDNTTVDIKSVGFFKSIQNFFARHFSNIDATEKIVDIKLKERDGQVSNSIQFTIGKATLKKQQETMKNVKNTLEYCSQIKTILSKENPNDEDLLSLQNNLNLLQFNGRNTSQPSKIRELVNKTIQEAQKYFSPESKIKRLCSSNKNPEEIKAEVDEICQEINKNHSIVDIGLYYLNSVYRIAKKSLPEGSSNENSPVLQSILSAIQDEIDNKKPLESYNDAENFSLTLTSLSEGKTDPDIINATKGKIYDLLLNFYKKPLESYNKSPKSYNNTQMKNDYYSNLENSMNCCFCSFRCLKNIFPPNDGLIAAIKSKITNFIDQVYNEALTFPDEFAEWNSQHEDSYDPPIFYNIEMRLEQCQNPEDESEHFFSKEEYAELQTKIDTAKKAIKEEIY